MLFPHAVFSPRAVITSASEGKALIKDPDLSFTVREPEWLTHPAEAQSGGGEDALPAPNVSILMAAANLWASHFFPLRICKPKWSHAKRQNH